jgi:hypothetical protein
MRNVLVVFAVLVAAVLFAGCARTQTAETTPPAQAEPAEPDAQLSDPLAPLVDVITDSMIANGVTRALCLLGIDLVTDEVLFECESLDDPPDDSGEPAEPDPANETLPTPTQQ